MVFLFNGVYFKSGQLSLGTCCGWVEWLFLYYFFLGLIFIKSHLETETTWFCYCLDSSISIMANVKWVEFIW